MLPLRACQSGEFYYQGTETDEQLIISKIDRPRLTGFMPTDFETISLKDRTAIGIGYAINPLEAYYFPVLPNPSRHLPFVMGMLADEDITKVYHNGNFDLLSARKLAIEERLPEPDVWNREDTAIMAQVSGHKVALETFGTEYLGHDDLFSIQSLLEAAKTKLGKRSVNMLDLPTEEAALKCGNDVRVTWEIYEYLKQHLSTLPQVEECYDIDNELLSVLKEIEQIGLGLRQDKLDTHYERLNRQAILIRDICINQLGFNPGSSAQVGYVLASKGHILPLTKGRKQLKSSSDLLEKIDDGLAGTILAYREATKLLSTYIVPWRGEERAYTHFRLDLSTGRLGSFERNLQNLPPNIRDIFAPDKGVFTWADMSQVEMRVFAYVTKDPVMVDAYATGKDLHSITQERLWPGQPQFRNKAKTFNFAMIYYATVQTLMDRCGLSREAATSARNEWLALYYVGHAWMRKMFEGRYPYVEDIFGRRMRIPTDEEIYDSIDWSDWRARGKYESMLNHVRRTQVNYPIQASAAALNKRGLLMTHDWGMDTRLQVHDEYLWDGAVDVPKELDWIHPELHTPFEAKQGAFWTK